MVALRAAEKAALLADWKDPVSEQLLADWKEPMWALLSEAV